MSTRAIHSKPGIPEAQPVLLTEVQTAQLLGLSRQTLSDWRYRKVGLPFIKLGSRIRYDVRDINAYINQHKQEIKEAA